MGRGFRHKPFAVTNPPENSRNIPLEFYFRCDSDVRSGIGPLGLIGAKEIKIPFYCNPCASNQFEVFNAGITYLHARAVLTVLNNGIVQIQFVLGVGDDIVSTEASEVKPRR